MRKETVEQIWQSYRNKVMSPFCPEIQYKECRIAFYAGFHALMEIMMAIGDESVSEDEGEEYMAQLANELQAFIKEFSGRIDDEVKGFLKSEIERLAPGIRTSEVFASLVSKSYLDDPLCALQLGLAIFMDKPIFLIVDHTEILPKHLEKIADRIVRVDLKNREEMEQASLALADYMASLDPYTPSEH